MPRTNQNTNVQSTMTLHYATVHRNNCARHTEQQFNVKRQSAIKENKIEPLGHNLLNDPVPNWQQISATLGLNKKRYPYMTNSSDSKVTHSQDFAAAKADAFIASGAHSFTSSFPLVGCMSPYKVSKDGLPFTTGN